MRARIVKTLGGSEIHLEGKKLPVFFSSGNSDEAIERFRESVSNAEIFEMLQSYRHFESMIESLKKKAGII